MTLTTRGFYLLRAAECGRDAAAAERPRQQARLLKREREWLHLAAGSPSRQPR